MPATLPVRSERPRRPRAGARAGVPAQPDSTPRRAAWRLVGGGLVALLLAAVFMAYLDPHLAVDLANRVWACF